jgi:MFS family permease
MEKLKNPASRRSLYCFLATIFLWCLFYGGVKFFMKNISKEFFDIDPAILLENIATFLSIGATIAYVTGGALSNMFTKRNLLLAITGLVSIVLFIEYTYGLSNYALLAISMIIAGFGYGTFAILRTIITYIEIVRTKLPDTTVNGVATICFVLAIILGAFLSTLLFEKIGNNVFWVFLFFLLLAMIPASQLRYPQFEHRRHLKESFTGLFADVYWIGRQKAIVLIASASMWATATVVSLKSIPYSMNEFGIPESQSSLVLVFSSLGVIVGNALTVNVKNRWLVYRCFAYFFAFLVFFFFHIAVSFPLIIAYSLLVGISMGAATNLVDSHYLSFIGKAHKKENGSAMQGFLINFSVASLLFVLHYLPESYVFPVMGTLVVVSTFLIRLNLPQLKDK